MSYADLLLQRSLQALDTQGPEHEWEETSTYDFSDPVALVTEARGDREPLKQIAGLDYSEFEKNFTPAQGRARGRHQEVSQKAQRGPVDPIIDVPGYASMTTGDFARKMLARKGLEYEWGGTSAKTGFDCSGIIHKIMVNNGFKNVPRHSADIYAHSKKVSLKKAINTRGAILYKEGHIAVSLGNGKTIEAMGEDYGVVVGNAKGRFTHGGILPELVVSQSKGRAGKKPKNRPVTFDKRDPLNRLQSVSSLTAAPIVFGSIWSEVAQRPTDKRGWDRVSKDPSLHFVPQKYRKLFSEAAEKYGLPARLLATVAQHESSFDPNAVSSAGAQGLMQIMPLHGLDNPFKPKENVMAGARILASYIERMGSLRLGLAAYNAGPSNHEAGLGYADSILDALYDRKEATYA